MHEPPRKDQIKRRVGRPAVGRKKATVGFSLSHELNDKLHALALRKGISMSQLVEDALLKLLKDCPDAKGG